MPYKNPVLVLSLALVLVVGDAAAPVATPRRVTVIEVPNQSFPSVANKIETALASEGFAVIAARTLMASARAQNLAKLNAEQLRKLARASGVERLVRVKISGARDSFAMQIVVEATQTRQRVYATRLILASNRFDAATAQQLARAIHAADSGRTRPGAEPVSLPADELLAEEDLTTEQAEEDEELDPDEPHGREVRGDRFIGSVGYAMLERNAQAGASFGTPPRYDGALSPGLALALSVFPSRLSDGSGPGRDFGIYVRGLLAFMPSALGGASVAAVRTDLYYALQGGMIYRHVFGGTDSDFAIGGELGARWDFMHLANDLPYPDTMFLSPTLSFFCEVPLWPRHLVLLARAGVMPVSAVSTDQIAFFGTRRYAFGIDAMLGLRVPIYRGLSAQAAGVFSHYWQTYSGTGGAGFTSVSGRDLVGGFTVSLALNH